MCASECHELKLCWKGFRVSRVDYLYHSPNSVTCQFQDSYKLICHLFFYVRFRTWANLLYSIWSLFCLYLRSLWFPIKILKNYLKSYFT